MLRNSGIIGPTTIATLTNASGVFDTFDNVVAKYSGTWPGPKRVTAITPANNISFNEGSTITCTVQTENYLDGVILGYRIISQSGVTTADFTDNLMSGTVSITNNAGSFNKTLVFDATAEIGDSFYIEILDQQFGSVVLATSGLITINSPSIVFSPTYNPVSEGQIASWYLIYQNINSGTILYYTFSGTAAPPGDYNNSFGTLTVGTNNAVGIAITEDFFTEGTETLTLDIRISSYTGAILASNTISINDSSQSVIGNISANPSVDVSENNTLVTVTVSTTNFAIGTLYWTLTEATAGEVSALSGSVSISNSSGSFSFTVLPDSLTEGTETWTIQLRSGSTTGTIINTTNITVADTSTTPAFIYGFTFTSKTPVLGSAGANPWPPTGWIEVFNGNSDDNSYAIPIPSTNYNGSGRTTAYVGTNGYITFGSGSSVYSSLSASNPNLSKIMMCAADNSLQRLAYIATVNYTKIRFEGTAATSGSAGFPGMVYEATFYPTSIRGTNPTIEIVFGDYRTGGFSGLYSTTTRYATWSPAANTSYALIAGNTAGTSWTIYSGARLSTP
jgi:hypothetical protein